MSEPKNPQERVDQLSAERRRLYEKLSQAKQAPRGQDLPWGESKDARLRILTMDGGGIYGYSTALMLRWLCTQNDTFLQPSEERLGYGGVWAFAGTSAGALNALLLASSESPRDAVLSGKLEAFWKKRGMFAHDKDPKGAERSWSGDAAWLGAEDYEDLLEEEFGELTLGDLPHRVMLTVFDWKGTGDSSWQPRIYANFPPDDPERGLLVRHVAYAAGAPPGLRPVRWGIGDGGIANPDPSRAALMEVLERFGRGWAQDSRDRELYDLMSRIHLLSLGVCTKVSRYDHLDFDAGPSMLSLQPSQPAQGDYLPPMAKLMTEVPTRISVDTCRVLLGERFHRLAPQLLGPPETPDMLTASALARFPAWQRYLIDIQEQALRTEIATEALEGASRFIEGQWRLGAAANSP